MSTRARNVPLHFSLIASLAFFIGCDFRVEEGKAQGKVHLLEKEFGISWPTNCSKMYGATLSAAGNVSEIVVRLEMTEATFLEWRQSATNRLKEYQSFSAPVDPKLEERFPWWDCAKIPAARVTAFFNEARAEDGKGGYVGAYVVETNGTYIMYVQGSPMR